MVDTLIKTFRVADKALVVYHGRKIRGVRYADGSSWCVWNDELHRWQKATPDEARGFEVLPLSTGA